MKPRFWDYVKAAFSARPIGMFVPPNWVGLGLVGLLGLVNPGFWLLGTGLELGYLYTLSTNRRFQRVLNAEWLNQSRSQWEERVNTLLGGLDLEERRRYRALEARCQEILELQMRGGSPPPGLDAQGESLGRLTWLYLRLLLAKNSIARLIREAETENHQGQGIENKIKEVQAKLFDDKLGAELRKSLAAQLEILQQRGQKRLETREKLVYLDAELMRIQEQVELIREQAVLPADPQAVSGKIDQTIATLGGTTQWVQEQRAMFGNIEDLLEEPPPVVAREMLEQRT